MRRGLSFVVAAVLLAGVSDAAADLTQASTAVHVAVAPTPSTFVTTSTTSTSLSVPTTTSTSLRPAPPTSLARKPTSTACAATGPRHDVVQQGAITGTAAAFVAALTARFLAVGAQCPVITMTPVELVPANLPTSVVVAIPRTGSRVEDTWIGTPGENVAAADAYSAYFLSEGVMTIRPVVGGSALPCTGSPDLAGSAPADAEDGNRCLHLGAATATSPKIVSASASPTSDPSTWTLRFVMQSAPAHGQWYVSVDGYGLGVLAFANDPNAFTTTGPFQGGEQEARARVADVVYPIGPFSIVTWTS
jgi:hypothetical protein